VTSASDENKPAALYVMGADEVLPRVSRILGTISRKFALSANCEIGPKVAEVLTGETLDAGWIAFDMKEALYTGIALNGEPS
jgi:hypothetical protein